MELPEPNDWTFLEVDISSEPAVVQGTLHTLDLHPYGYFLGDFDNFLFAMPSDGFVRMYLERYRDVGRAYP